MNYCGGITGDALWFSVCNGCSAARVLQECTMKVQEGKFKLQDLLVVPMQRVLKYHLLLKVGANPAAPDHFTTPTFGMIFERPAALWFPAAELF